MSRPLDATPPVLWDGVVRLSHWALATVVIGNTLITKGGGTVHVWLGWIGMALLTIRLVWGLVGPAEARFTAFPPSPRAALAHLGDLARGRPRDYPSHNPAGAIMVYTLWSTLAAVIISGLVLTSGATPFEVARQKAAVAAGDWAALAAQSAEDEAAGLSRGTRHAIGLIHETGGNLLILLAVLHVGGVLVESLALRRNLLRPMVAGNAKPRRTPPDHVPGSID